VPLYRRPIQFGALPTVNATPRAFFRYSTTMAVE
jgi:hypothetical protein